MENEMLNFDSFSLHGNKITNSDNKFDQFPLIHLNEKHTNFTISSSATEVYHLYYSFIQLVFSAIILLVLIDRCSVMFSIKLAAMVLNSSKYKNAVQNCCAFLQKEAQGAFSICIIPSFLPYHCGKSLHHLLSPYTHGHCLIDHSGGTLPLVKLTQHEKESLQNRKTTPEGCLQSKGNSNDVILNIENFNNPDTNLINENEFEDKDVGQRVTEQGHQTRHRIFTATTTNNQPPLPVEKAKEEVNHHINEDQETKNYSTCTINDLEGKAPEIPRLYSVGDSQKPNPEANCSREWASSKLPCSSDLNYDKATNPSSELTYSPGKLQTKVGKVIIGNTKCILGAGDTPAYYGGIAQIMHPSNHPTAQESSPRNFLQKGNDLKKFKTDAHQWINEHMTPDTIEDLSNGNLSFDFYTNSSPLELNLSLVVGVLKDFNSTIQNAFDNFTCFSGKGDMAQFQRLYERAIQRSREILHQSMGKHGDVKIYENIMNDACSRLVLIYESENREITTFEGDLLEEMLPKIIKKYQKKFKSYLKCIGKNVGRNVQDALLKDIHSRMVSSITKLINYSMNYDDKLNKVVSIFTDKIVKILDNMFDSFLSSFYQNIELSRNQIEQAIASYVAQVREIPENLTVEKIQSWHQKNMINVASQLAEHQRKEVLLRLHTYLMHLYEKSEQKNFVHMNAADDTVCIQISAGKIQHGCKVNRNGTRETVTSTRSPDVSYITKSSSGTINVSTVDKQSNFLKCSRTVESDTTLELERVVKPNRGCRSKHASNNRRQAILIVPTWTTIRQRHALHKTAVFHKYENTFVVNETSMAAYAFLKEKTNQNQGKCGIVAIFSLDNSGIQVELYGFDQNDCLKLYGISFETWRDKILEATSVFGGAQLDYYELSPVNYRMKIEIAYNSATRQLPGGIINVNYYCLVAVDEFNDVEHMKNFLSENTCLCNWDDNVVELAFKGGMMFVDKPQEIIKTILDYATFAQVAENDKDPVEEKIIKNMEKLDYDDNCDKLVEKKEDLDKRKEKLIERCESIQNILKTKSCRLPMLVIKDIKKKVSDVRQVASLPATQLAELEQGNKIIESLVVKYPIMKQCII